MSKNIANSVSPHIGEKVLLSVLEEKLLTVFCQTMMQAKAITH